MKSYADMTVDELRAELARVKAAHTSKLAEITAIDREIARLKGGAK